LPSIKSPFPRKIRERAPNFFHRNTWGNSAKALVPCGSCFQQWSGDLADTNSDQVIAKLRQHAPELKAAGIVHLRVFGSVTRGETSAVSDIDLLADFDKSRRLTLVTVERLQSRLTDLLGVNVDLSAEEWMREPLRKQALREAVLAFWRRRTTPAGYLESIDNGSDVPMDAAKRYRVDTEKAQKAVDKEFAAKRDEKTVKAKARRTEV
jgi:predicted nucleotidyltransferase